MAGQEIGLDAYPYIASSTVLRTQRIEDALKVLITWSKSAPEQAGRELADIARDWGVGIVEAAERLQPAGAIYFMMNEADVRRVLAFPHTMIGSDGLPHDVHPHPRLWGTFPRVLGHYSRDEGLFPLEEAVRRMSSDPADFFGIRDRGRIKPGLAADLVIFSEKEVASGGRPERLYDLPGGAKRMVMRSHGIEYTIVNGVVTWEKGRLSGAAAGEVLRS